MNFEGWLQLYTERMDDTPGLTQFGRESWDACKKEVLDILKECLSNDDLDRLEERIKKL